MDRRRLLATFAGVAVGLKPSRPWGSTIDASVSRVLGMVGRRPAWDAGQAHALSAAVGDARRHGLSPQALLYKIERSGAHADAGLTTLALAYATALARGATEPERIHRIFTLERHIIDLERGLAEALRSRTLSAWLRRLPPSDAEYEALSGAYLRLIEADAPAWIDLPAGQSLREGMADARTPLLRRRLARMGFAVKSPASKVYDAEMAEAVRQLQAERGIAVDGVIGPQTLAVLNTGPADRARQLAVNLERRRWLARAPAAERIDVNTAAAELAYWREGRIERRARVVVGSPGSPTPQLGERLDRLIVNPPWYVPTSIAEAEILPRGPAYLARRDMYLSGGRVIQRPGPQAALGRVKFDIQNRWAIYLHDTPAKALFESPYRHRSHGCVRVEEAVAFARSLAALRGLQGPFDAMLASGETSILTLGASLDVRLLHHSAFATEEGRIRFTPDYYGWDEAVARALGLGSGRVLARSPLPPALFGP